MRCFYCQYVKIYKLYRYFKKNYLNLIYIYKYIKIIRDLYRFSVEKNSPNICMSYMAAHGSLIWSK